LVCGAVVDGRRRLRRQLCAGIRNPNNYSMFEIPFCSKQAAEIGILKRPRVCITLLLTALLAPFLAKPVQTDDYIFVRAAQWIQSHPLNFFGGHINWWFSDLPLYVANCNPPLQSYYLAIFGATLGWSVIVLHAAMLLVTIASGWGIFSLAERWCMRPLLATTIAILTPAFLVSGSSLMCDLPALGLCIWALVLWESALEVPNKSWRFLASGVIAGLALLTKYNAFLVLPIMFLLAVLRRNRSVAWWLPGLAIPALVLAAYELATSRMYGLGLFSAAVHYAHSQKIEFPGGLKARTIIGLAFTGASLLPIPFCALLVSRPKWALIAAVAAVVLFAGVSHFWIQFGLLVEANPELVRHWFFAAQIALWSISGLCVLALVGMELWRKSDIISIVLVAWTVGGLLFATVLNWNINARSMLPIVPAASILLARNLTEARMNRWKTFGLALILMFAAAVAISLNWADYNMAGVLRNAARDMWQMFRPPTMWFQSHGTFQYYMENNRARAVDISDSSFEAGDLLVVPWLNNAKVTLPAGSVRFIGRFVYQPSSILTLFGGTEKGTAGFYGANSGPVPFVFAPPPEQEFLVTQLTCRLRLHTVPENLNSLKRDVPQFGKLNYSSVELSKVMLGISTQMEQCSNGVAMQKEGKEKEAITCYRQILGTNEVNVAALNNLAWLLSCAVERSQRNGTEAVLLASRAVELTNRSFPLFLGSLAAALAEKGDFAAATQTAEEAINLVRVIGDNRLAMRNSELRDLYQVGKTADELREPSMK
jgi:4-amino-4-deoxy-L-arabinose transferase-like glycosyltransferase